MAHVKKTEASQWIKAWQQALPSQINDSFHQIAGGKQERLLAFSLPQEHLEELRLAKDKRLQLFYGLDVNNTNSAEPAFKMLLGYNKKGKNTRKTVGKAISHYCELEPLSHTTITKNLAPQIQRSLIGSSYQGKSIGNTNPVDVNIETLTDEFISPVFEHYLHYDWLRCNTSSIVDKVETLYKGQRVRIERSTYEATVTKILLEIHKKNPKRVTTLFVMGLHQVIPGDHRIFHFGPVLRAFIQKKKLSSKGKSDDVTVLADQSQNTYDVTNFELSYPCPPACEPPDDNE